MTDLEIEEIFKNTIGGFYIYQCVKNGSMDKQFYKDQLKVFTEGFNLGLNLKDK